MTRVSFHRDGKKISQEEDYFCLASHRRTENEDGPSAESMLRILQMRPPLML